MTDPVPPEENTVSNENPMRRTDETARRAAEAMYAHLAELEGDVMDDMAFEDPKWMKLVEEGDLAKLEAYAEPRFRAVLAELALMVQARALGRYPTTEASRG